MLFDYTPFRPDYTGTFQIPQIVKITREWAIWHPQGFSELGNRLYGVPDSDEQPLSMFAVSGFGFDALSRTSVVF